jgi:hypothetical protein
MLVLDANILIRAVLGSRVLATSIPPLPDEFFRNLKSALHKLWGATRPSRWSTPTVPVMYGRAGLNFENPQNLRAAPGCIHN